MNDGFETPDQGMARMTFCSEEKVDAEIARLLGATVLELLRDPMVQEVSANYDQLTGACRLFADFGKGPMSAIEATLSPASIITVTRLLATQHGQSMQPSAPFLSCVLQNGFRFHAALSQLCGGPKLSNGPSFSIRAHPRMTRPLSDFMSALQAQFMAAAIEMQWTILVAVRHAEAARRRALRDAVRQAADAPPHKPLNFAYAISGPNVAWKPVLAFDDGEHTYLQFPDNTMSTDMPTLMVQNGNQQALVNYQVRGSYYVADRLFKSAALTAGTGTNRGVVQITAQETR